MKYALIGCGRIAINHVKAVDSNNLEFVAACDIAPGKIESLFSVQQPKNVENIIRYTDYKKMISEHPEIELIAIATSSGVHAELALYCIENGINVIIEKPMAMSMADANAIVRKSEEKGVIVSVCHQNRFNLAVQKTRKAVEKGRLGKISHGSISVRWNRNKEYYEQATWRGTWLEDGGCLMNQCIHGIDLLRWLMEDEVESVYGVTRQQFHHYLEAEDVGIAIVQFKNGAIAHVEGTVNVYPKNLEETLYLFGEDGMVKLGGTSCNNIDIWEFADNAEEDQRNKGLEEMTSNVYGNGHSSLYSDVIDSIENQRKPYVDAIAGRNALEMILAIYKSMKTGQPVHFPLDDFECIEMNGIFN